MMTYLYSRYDFSVGLSSEEIFEISQDINRNFTPNIALTPSNLATTLTSEEMLAISEEISRDFSPSVSIDTPQLVLLPVDPEHLYAYWNALEQGVSAPAAKLDESLTLRIYTEPCEHQEAQHNALWFDVAVEHSKMQQQVKLPISMTERAYSATIGKLNPDESFAAFANSNSIHVPRTNKRSGFSSDTSAISQIMSQFFLNNEVEMLAYPCEHVSSQGHYQ